MDDEAYARDRGSIPLPKWLKVLDDEYLREYLRDGGAAVKVISGDDDALARAVEGIRERAESADYHVAILNPDAPAPRAGAATSLHRQDHFLFQITASVDWNKVAERQAERFLKDEGLRIEPGYDLGDYWRIAQENGRSPDDLINQYERSLTNRLLNDREMALEFRAAVLAPARGTLLPEKQIPNTKEAVIAWLCGLPLQGCLPLLRKIQVYEKINQSNAKYILQSLCRWLPNAGKSGLVAVLDLRPYTRIVAPAATRQAAMDGKALPKQYPKRAYWQMLELIRDFIDSTDRFQHFLLVILTSPDYYAPESKRRYTDYEALKTRIGIEVYDPTRANPAAALVHLGGEE